VKFPIGDVLRSFVAPDSVLGKILAALKGITIKTKSGNEILLDHDHVFPAGESPLDNRPHQPGPADLGIRPWNVK